MNFKKSHVGNFSTIILFCISLNTLNAYAKPTSVNIKELDTKSDCVVRGTVKKIVSIEDDGKPFFPQKIKIVSIEVQKIIKKNSDICSADKTRIDVVYSDGPSDHIESESCSTPIKDNTKRDFYLTTTNGIVSPALCYGWIR